jgi:hypothetical protein
MGGSGCDSGVFAEVPTLSGGLCCLWKRNRAFGAYRDAPAGCPNDSLCGVAGLPSSKTLARFPPSEDRRLTDLECSAIEAGELSRKKIAALADSTGTLVSITAPRLQRLQHFRSAVRHTQTPVGYIEECRRPHVGRQEVKRGSVYSWRSAAIGSTLIARHAGTEKAASAMRPIAAMTLT